MLTKLALPCLRGAGLLHPALAPQHGQSASLAAPELGSCASSGRAWQLWEVPLGA